MAQVTITSRVDQRDSDNFNAFCASVGMDASTAISLFVKAVLRENRIPFEITPEQDPFYNAVNQAHVLKSVMELRQGKGTPHELIEVEDE